MEIVRSIHGANVAGWDISDRFINRQGFVAGRKGYEIPLRSPHHVTLFEDFERAPVALSTTIGELGLRSRKGSDAECVDWTVTPAANGTIVGTIGDTTASMAVSGVQLDSDLCWLGENGELVIQVRIALSQITTISAFVGFTDQVSGLEMPIHSAASANTITTNATDAVGFMFDTSMTADNWWLVGVDGGTDATHQDTETAPTADTFEVLRIEVGVDGSAVFYRNGVIVGTKMTGAVSPDVPLTPVVAGFNRDTSGNPTITVDYLAVSALRA